MKIEEDARIILWIQAILTPIAGVITWWMDSFVAAIWIVALYLLVLAFGYWVARS